MARIRGFAEASRMGISKVDQGLSSDCVVGRGWLHGAQLSLGLLIRFEGVGPSTNDTTGYLVLRGASLEHSGHGHSKLLILHLARDTHPEVNRRVEVAAKALAGALQEKT